MLARLGWTVIAAGLALGLLDLIIDALVSAADPGTLRGALWRAAYREIRTPVRPIVVVVIVTGALIMLTTTGRVAHAGERAVSWAHRVARRARSAVRSQPTTAWGRAARAAGLVAAGLFLILKPESAGRLLALAAGLALLAVAAAGFAPQGETADVVGGTPAHEQPRRSTRGRGWRVPVAVATVAVLLLAFVVAVTARPTLGDDPAPDTAAPAQTCDGFAALCERRYDQIAFPATHNAMAAADQPGWRRPPT